MRRRRTIAALVVIPLSGAAAAQSYEQFFRALDVDNASRIAELLARGFDPNTPDERGHLPLYLALRNGSLEAAKLLVDHPQTKIDAMNAFGETPLMMAALKGRVDWMQRLLARGARVVKEGWTPLHYAATGPEPLAVALLLEKGAAIDAPAPNGSTALMMAAQYGAEDSALMLVARGADTALRNRGGETASDVARRAGREVLAQRLVSPVR